MTKSMRVTSSTLIVVVLGVGLWLVKNLAFDTPVETHFSSSVIDPSNARHVAGAAGNIFVGTVTDSLGLIRDPFGVAYPSYIVEVSEVIRGDVDDVVQVLSPHVHGSDDGYAVGDVAVFASRTQDVSGYENLWSDVSWIVTDRMPIESQRARIRRGMSDPVTPEQANSRP